MKALKLTKVANNLAKRIIPCLDVKNDQVVKGIKFKNLTFAGDPVELAKKYANAGADELVFLDITATLEKRKTLCSMVEKIAKNIFIPFTVGGGIKSIKDIKAVLKAGADKIAINTAGVLNPKLIREASKKFGSQCIVVAIDAKKIGNDYYVYINSGNTKTKLKVLDWVQQVEKLGAGEILLTAIDRDGTKTGFDNNLLRQITATINIPVIASGGAGKLSDFRNVFINGRADAVLAASLFHSGRLKIKDLKKYLAKNTTNIRL
ncbi:MAG: imidazole glycerol phosphate synthase subunit HisF [Candidatus Magasanikiibacteriota bacterium]